MPAPVVLPGDRRPMAGIRVLDMATVLMGPLATQVMGDYGADVIKIEPPEGDVARHAGASRHSGMGAIYMATGRNKRSVVLDIKQPQGKAALLALSASSDVFIHNVRPAAMRRAGLDYTSLQAINPSLIYVALVGFGDAGRYANRPAFDDIIQGAGGVAGLFLRSGQTEPIFIPWNVADRMTGISAVHATLAALLLRARTGEGQAIEVPMFETIAQMVLGDHLSGMAFEPAQGAAGYGRLLTPGRQPYKTADGHVVVTPYNDKQFKALFDALGRTTEMQDNPILRTLETRQRHWPAIYALLKEAFVHRSSDEWVQLCDAAQIPCTPVRTLESLVADPHLADVGFFQLSDHPTEGRIREMRPPATWSSADVAIRRHAPTLGEHSVEVLGELGYGEADIQAMLEAGVTRDGRATAQADH